MSSARDFEAADGELGRWIDARTIEVLEDLEQHWGCRFDEARVRELVAAFLGLRGSAEALSKEDRFSLVNGAALALLGGSRTVAAIESGGWCSDAGGAWSAAAVKCAQ